MGDGIAIGDGSVAEMGNCFEGGGWSLVEDDLDGLLPGGDISSSCAISAKADGA
jgi:hypothetical protein